jgi:glycosyltransferase involved in cell wall biosynthesis
MKPSIRVLIFVKSLDGGTGTYTEDIQLLSKPSKTTQIILQTLVLETPKYRHVSIPKNNFFAPTDYYPETYGLTFRNIVFLLKELFWVKNRINHYKPDIIVTIDAHCLVIAQLASIIWSPGTKILATIHNNLSEILHIKSTPLFLFVAKPVIRFFLTKAQGVVCVSRQLAEDLYRSFDLKKKPSVIYYGLKSVRRNPVQGKLHTPRVITCVSRLVEQKDHDTLVKAFFLAQQVYPDMMLYIVGDGPLKEKIQEKVRKLGIKEKVIFTGWVQDSRNNMAESDIVILSSRREGFGYVLIEAMQMGKPVIATDSPYGPSEILEGDTYGLLVPKGDAEAMKQAMLRILSNKTVYQHYVQASLKRSRMFSMNNMINQYRQVITSL